MLCCDQLQYLAGAATHYQHPRTGGYGGNKVLLGIDECIAKHHTGHTVIYKGDGIVIVLHRSKIAKALLCTAFVYITSYFDLLIEYRTLYLELQVVAVEVFISGCKYIVDAFAV